MTCRWDGDIHPTQNCLCKVKTVAFGLQVIRCADDLEDCTAIRLEGDYIRGFQYCRRTLGQRAAKNAAAIHIGRVTKHSAAARGRGNHTHFAVILVDIRAITQYTEVRPILPMLAHQAILTEVRA